MNGFVFFGSANGLLERIRKRVEAGPLRFLVIDLRRVTGVDSSAVVAFVKVMHLAEAAGFELVFTGASDPCAASWRAGGWSPPRSCGSSPTWTAGCSGARRGCSRDEALVAAAADGQDGRDERWLAGMPAGLRRYLERVALPEGAVLDPPGRAARRRVRAGVRAAERGDADGRRDADAAAVVSPGVVVGEVAMYTGVPRTADVVAETPSVVLRLTGASIERIEAEDPELAAALHRWLAGVLSERLSDTLREFDALLD